MKNMVYKKAIIILLSLALMLAFVSCAMSDEAKVKLYSKTVEEQIKGIEDPVSGTFELEILGADGTVYSNCTVEIAGTQIVTDAKGMPAKEEYAVTVDYAGTGGTGIVLNPGKYTATVTDNFDPSNTFTHEFAVTDGTGKSKLSIGTDFEVKALVTDGECTRFDWDDHGFVSIYAAPRINLPNDLAAEVNSQMHKELYTEYFVRRVQHSLQPEVGGINYLWYENGDVISILACVVLDPLNAPDNLYFTYNVSKETGKLLTTEEVVESCGYDYDEYLEWLAKYTEGKFVDKHYRSMGGSYDHAIEAAKSETLSRENLEAAQVFIDGNGELCAAVTLHTIAGSGFEMQVFSLWTGLFSELPECMIR